jgi:small subunit ribosomal protein S2
MPYVNQRWLGGMLTNFGTVFKRLQRLKELEEVDFDDVAGSTLTKKELLHLKREHDKLDRSLGGIRHMTRVPSAIWVVDTKKEHIAVSEARKLGIPVIAILDTNCDPDEVTYPIPGNDDAIRSVALLTRVIADAVADGLISRAGQGAEGDEKPSAELGAGDIGTKEPLAEWERDLLPGKPAAEGAGAEIAVNGSAPAADAAAPAEAPSAAPAATATTATTEAAPATEAAATEAATTEAPAEAPVPEAAATEAAATESATTEAAPVTEAPATEAPATEAQATEAAVAESAATEAAATEAPAEAPAPEAATTEAATTEAATTEAATTEA